MDPAEKAGQTTDHSATQANHSGSQIRLEVLKNVVAYVDVKTAEGDEAGGVFVDILRSLGARVSCRAALTLPMASIWQSSPKA